MLRPFVKICGLTRAEDAEAAVRLGATHVGCVLVASSPRRVGVEQARRVFEAAGDRVAHVLVFKREEPRKIMEVAEASGTRHVQIYGFDDDEARRLERAGLIVYRVHEVALSARSLPVFMPMPHEKCPIVLDVRGGGSGVSFSWEMLGERAPHATFIAGGIRPENIAALMKHRPYGVDLSSGVEETPGIKDPRRIRLFFENLEKSL